MFFQKTLSKTARIQGVGLHTGRPVELLLCPASVNTGLQLVRSDLPGKPSLPVSSKHIVATQRATSLGNEEFSISTVEHCLSVLAAFHIDNLLIQLNGPELPIGDGSGNIFLEALLKTKIVTQDQPRQYLSIQKPVYYGTQEKHAYVLPYQGLRIHCTIQFNHPQIGLQSLDLDIHPQSFQKELVSARTFGFLKDIEKLRTQGLTLGGSLENAIVLNEKKVLNPEGLRFKDEFVRHKILDAIGDLRVLETPLLGHLVLYKAGHNTLYELIRKILSSPDCYTKIELGTPLSSRPSFPHLKSLP